jgi:hypothetical protein
MDVKRKNIIFRCEINNDGLLGIIWEHKGEKRKENEDMRM